MSLYGSVDSFLQHHLESCSFDHGEGAFSITTRTRSGFSIALLKLAPALLLLYLGIGESRPYLSRSQLIVTFQDRLEDKSYI